ncbi:unnamed protein product [Effrenium voratum]|uniref:glutamate decarboxylase n=1 Tax=Effrenium voratum TaxID=2562239 RepID=A0AA36IJ09_9DINO|nr:unnamed protein product [Effrenium voratum]
MLVRWRFRAEVPENLRHGHWQADYNALSAKQRTAMTHEFLADVEVLREAAVCVCTFSSNVGRLVALLRDGPTVSVDVQVGFLVGSIDPRLLLKGDSLARRASRVLRMAREMEKAYPKSHGLPLDLNWPYYASPLSCSERAEDMEIPQSGTDARHCVRMVEDYHLLDFSERLNTSSYVNVVFEPEEERVAMMGLKVNLADQTVYPESFRMHNDTLNMIAKLWHCPKPDDFDEKGCYAGAGTVGSTEACLLAGLALKFRWRKWYAKRKSQSPDQVRGVYPNLVISTMFQAAWEKLFKYMDIEPRFVKPSYKTFILDPNKLKDYIDDQTIGVVCIMGNHYGGQYDPVWEVDAALDKINAEKGLQVGIHVDAASGGFIAPFQDNLPKWDFRLKNVLSISASGHKFGNSCCGTGWVIWRQRKDLSEEVAINVSYLGGSADSYTLNFSRPAQGVYVQFYKLLRLGREGYYSQVNNQMCVAQYLREGLLSVKEGSGSVFTILDAVGMSSQKVCLPVVTAMINPDLGLPFDDIDFQHVIAQGHWYVSGYHMSMHHPLTEETMPLFTDQTCDQAMFRIVVKNNLTMRMAAHLLDEIKAAVAFLINHGKGFQHRKPKRLPTQKSVPVGCSAESRRSSAQPPYLGLRGLGKAAMALAVMAPVRPVPMSPPARPARLRVPAPPRARSGAGPGGVKAAAAAALAAKAAAKVCARKSRSLGYAACMAQDARRADVRTAQVDSAMGVFVQFYKLLRLGREGYTGQVENQMSVAQFLREGLQSIQHNGESVFTLLDAVGMSSQKLCLPVVTAMINPELGLPFDDIDFQHVVAQGHWYVSGYHMSMHHPLTEETTPLFTDQPSEQAMFRIVVKNNLTMRMAANLLDEMKTAVQFLISHGKGFQHRKPKRLHTHKAVPAC